MSSPIMSSILSGMSIWELEIFAMSSSVNFISDRTNLISGSDKYPFFIRYFIGFL